MPAGRPSKYSEELASAICHRMAEGESLREICRSDDMPDRTTVMRWAVERPEFHDQYARAIDLRADHWADEILEISDDGSNDYQQRQNADGTTYETINHEHVQRSKLRVDSRKWLMSKLASKRYGDRVTQEITGKDGGAIEVADVGPVEAARRIAFALRQGTETDDT